MADYKDVIVEKDGGVLVLTFNRPERLNALNWRILKEATEVLDQAGSDDSVKVVVITGGGRGFCSGADLAPPMEGDDPEPPMDRRLKLTPFRGFGRLALTIRNCPKPVIAAVNGHAVGAGFTMALAADIRIASENAKFSSIFVRRGLMPDSGITYFLPRLIGTGKALELMYSGDIIDAAQAEKMDIVNRVVPHDELMPAAMGLAKKIAQGASMPIEMTKQAVYHGQTTDLETQLAFEAWAQELCHVSHDYKEGKTAFLERRDPAFRGE